MDSTRLGQPGRRAHFYQSSHGKWALGYGLSFVVAVCQTAHAVTPMRFERLGLDDGLSQQSANAIVQDAAGFLWIGTEDGLNRFDGYGFKHLRRDRSSEQSLPSNFVADIATDTAGRLWIATDGGGVAWREPWQDRFNTINSSAQSSESNGLERVRVIHFDRSGKLWIGTRESGLAVFDPAQSTLKFFRHVATDPATLGSDSICSLLEDRGGQIWIGTEAGLDRVIPSTGRLQRDPFGLGTLASGQALRVRALLEDDSGSMWIGTDLGLVRLDPRSGARTHYRHDPASAHALPANRVNTLFEDRQRRLWIGTTAGLALFDRRRDAFDVYKNDPADPASLPDDHVMSLFEDDSGLLWVGTKFAGVGKWNPRTWSFGHHVGGAEEGTKSRNIMSFTEDAEGRLWIATFGGGLTVLDRRHGHAITLRNDPQSPQSLSDDRVMALLTDREGTVWAGTMGGGLNRFDSGTLAPSVYRHDPSDPHTLGAAGVMSLLEDSKGRMWVGTFGGGLSQLDRGSGAFKRYVPNPSNPSQLASGRVTALAEDHAGRIWAGTDGGGLHVLDQVKNRFFRLQHDARDPNSLGSDTVYSLHVDSEGTLWVGTRGGGLDRVIDSSVAPEEIRFANVSETSGLPNNTIYGIRADAKGHLWLSTNHGLARLDPHTSEIRSFHRGHGLQGEEFNFGAHYGSRGGELFFGGANGYNAFDPARLQFNGSPPPVVLTSFLKLNKPARTDVALELIKTLHAGYRDDVITFEFAALDYAAPRANTFQYKLEGFDPDWVDAGPRRSVTYTSLSGGKYTLRVRAANADGARKEAGFGIALIVDPPPWKTRWAYAGYALALMLFLWALWAAHRRTLEREARYRRLLEDEVRNRTRELAERNSELEKVNGRLEVASLSDPLTGLGNRRSLMQVMPSLLTQAGARARHQQDDASRMVLMLIDLDCLKPINDRLGHEAGDHVLGQIAGILRDCVRDTDRVVRWGGDEFVLVHAPSDLDSAAKLAERIRVSVSKRRFRIPGNQVARTSCSIGFACFPFVPDAAKPLTWEEVLKLADMALYRAKMTRNAWVGWRGTRKAAAEDNLAQLLEADSEAAEQNGYVETRRSSLPVGETIELLLRKTRSRSGTRAGR